MGTSVFPERYTSHVIILFKFTLIEAGCLFDADSGYNRHHGKSFPNRMLLIGEGVYTYVAIVSSRKY